MSFLIVKNCCGCIDLETAGIIMGVLDIFFRISHAYAILNEDQKNLYFQLRGPREKTTVTMPPEIFAFLDCICIIVTVIYLLGIFNAKTKLMIPALFQSVVSVIAMMIYFIVAFVDFLKPSKRGEQQEFALFIYCISITVFFSYMWVIQYSLYKFIKKTNSDEKFAITYAKNKTSAV